MHKNILIGSLTIITLGSLVFAFYHKSRATLFEYQALQNELVAKEMRTQAEEHQKVANEQRAIAETYAHEVERLKEICKVAQSKITATR